MRKTALILLSVCLLIISACVSSADSGYVSVRSLDDCKGEMRDKIGDYNAPSGKTFLIVELEIENSGCNSFYVDPCVFEVEIGDLGYTIGASVATYSLSNYLDTVRLRDGGKITGRIAFSVPKGRGDVYCLEYSGWEDCIVRFSCPCSADPEVPL